jgi:hypothetical protein
MYGVTLMVFIVIRHPDRHDASECEHPFSDRTDTGTNRPARKTKGSFLLENGQFTEMALNLNVPKEERAFR